MKQKNIFIFLLPAIFLSIMLLSFVYFRRSSKPVSDIIPFQKIQPTPTEIFVPTPTPLDILTQIEGELNLIEKDIEKTNRDTRLVPPPSFIFELGVN